MARRTKAEREHAIGVQDAVTAAIYKGIEDNATDWRRDHLGASMVGHRCDRYLWLSFRWAINPKHDGRQLRLFSRGDREEPAIVANLMDAGMTVAAPCLAPDELTDPIFKVRWGHLGGSSDGQVMNVPGLGGHEWCLLEFKTANGKSFEYLKKKKVRSAKPEHFVQMQLYMDGRGLKHALYIVVRKDTDEIYVELVDFDQDVADKHKARAQAVIDADVPPDRLDKDFAPCVYVSKDTTRWPCQFFELCHGNAMPERNCRTCVSSTPVVSEGEPVWTCNSLDIIGPDTQRKGCDEQCSIPPIVNAQVSAVDGRKVTYQFTNGETKTEGKE